MSDSDITTSWEDVVISRRLTLVAGKVGDRINCLKGLKALVQKGGLEQTQIQDIVRLLLVTVPRFTDQPSRNAVLSVLEALLINDQIARIDEVVPVKKGINVVIIKWIESEVDKMVKLGMGTVSPSTRSSLLGWTNTVYDSLKKSTIELEEPQWNSIVNSLSNLLVSMLDEVTTRKPSMRKMAVVQVRRAIRNNQKFIPRLVATLTSAKVEPSYHHVSLLGLVLDVALHLKLPFGAGKVHVESSKSAVNTYFIEKVLSAKASPPSPVLHALDGFFAATVKFTDVQTFFLPAMERALIRTPDGTLPLVNAYFQSLALDSQPSTESLLSLLPSLLSSAKAASPSTRTSAIELFTTLFSKIQIPSELTPLVSQISSPLRTGKTVSPDHRTTLLKMLSTLPSSSSLSPELVELTLTLLPKETNEMVCSAMMQILSVHLPTSLSSGTSLTSIQFSSILKGMQEPKASIRRLLFFTVGEVLWSFDGEVSSVGEAVKGFGLGLLAGFENALKTVATNPLNSIAGPLEGYVTIAVMKGRLGTWGIPAIDSFIASNTTLQTILTTGAKPSFLLWDKVYRKATTVEDEAWLIYALESVLQVDEEKFNKDLSLRTAFTHTLIHVGIESAHYESRNALLEFVKRRTAVSPKLMHQIMRDGLRSYLLMIEKAKAPIKQIGDDDTTQDRTPRLRLVFEALTTFSESTPSELRADLVTQILILAHHPRLGAADAGLWIDLLQTAGVAPDALLESRLDQLLGLIWVDASSNPASTLFAEAAYRAATTLAFVAPTLVVPQLFAQFEDDLSVNRLEFIGKTEYGIWATPEGVAFVDVLTASKPKTAMSHKNSKEREIEIWENELREALARKRPVVATLSKPDRIILEKQLAKEAVIRAEIASALGRLRRGFALLLCLVRSKAELVKEYLATMVRTVLKVIVLRPATLVAPEAFATYQALGQICSDRLGQSSISLGVAVLRSVESQVVPESFCAEPVAPLVARVLYRLQILADQAPFDAGTYAYAAPLISRIIRLGGIGIEKSNTEASLEQLALALDFIAFHARQCGETAYPRLSMIQDLIATLISYPTLGRTATTALQVLGEAMKASATREEIEALLAGSMTEEVYVRFACLQAIQPLDLTELEFPADLWVACHDVDDRNRQLAAAAWEDNGLDVSAYFLDQLLPFLAHSSNAVRQATGHSVAEAISQYPEQVAQAIEQLIAEYHDKVKELLPVYDQYGMVIEESLTAEDPWRTRVAVATTLQLISVHFGTDNVEAFFALLIQGQALGDKSQAVRSAMLDAAIGVIDVHGKENLQSLIVTFEEYLAKPSTGEEVHDHITEALVILFGRLARHLDPTDPRIASVITRLVEALRTPSEVVQAAVCDCLPPLIKVIKDDVPDLVDELLTDLFSAPKYAERRGAAYGLAGVVRGRGVSALREFGVLGRLKDNAEDKKSLQARQGAIFGYEILSTVLGRLFEPYIVEILPLLLASFGDTSPDVRDATSDAAKAIMGKLSGHAVKLILPTLLIGLDDKQWRAKKGAIELMGAMAFLAPKQLSVSLPTIIPRLADVLTDTHKQVRESANTSLKRFGDVVVNPEIQAMQAVLLEALVDPSKKTPKALDALLATTFAHFIDASSLALIVPILDRGLRERSADVKRKASAIVGNMATLTDAKDLIPYLSQLVPLLRGVLVDPVPEARSTAAKSLGGLVERLGEVNFPDLIDTLMAVLKSPASGVDQQGAAQGVSEVLAGLGTERLEGLLPVILANTSSPRAYVREGHISLLIFLPATFGERFSPYLGKIIQPVLSGLADDSDYVREASMRAGRMIVANHSSKAIDLLLPELEIGLFDESWRIRQSSVQLVGDLLFRITGVSGKPDEDEDGEEDRAEDAGGATEQNKKALVETLGKDRRDRVLAALYIVRQDSTGVVRQAAIHVWKALVQNTPKTVREILGVLMQIIVRILASPGIEQRETAARCLAETCRKLGETVLGEVIAILQKAMASTDRRQREGVCLALTEIMANTNKSSLEAHEGTVIDIIRNALVDSEPIVRSAAAQAFDVAQQAIGPRSIDETIPTLLDALQTPGETADAALAALKEVMQVRAEKIFPVLIPRLIATPITAFNARALASLVRVAGSALGRRLTNIVDALQGALKTEKDEATLGEIDEALSAVLASVSDHESGLDSLLTHMLTKSKGDSPTIRVDGLMLCTKFCQVTEADFSDYHIDFIRQLVSLFDDRAGEVVGAAWQALDAMVKTIEKEDMEPLVVALRRTIESTGTPGVPVDGFSRVNGLKPILPILLQGLLAGTGEQREQAAYAIGDLVERTAPEAFKAYCIQTVGPLIRVIGDRFPAPVKSAILSTLTILLERVPAYVRPFLPQLQRTFVKSLTDPGSSSVRNRGVIALGVLMLNQPRIDPVITELTNLAASEAGEVRDSVVNGLAAAVKNGKILSDVSKSSILELLSESFAETNKEPYNVAIARLMASMGLHDPPSLEYLITSFLVGDLPATQLSSIALREIIDTSPQTFYDLDLAQNVVKKVIQNASAASPPSIARPAREAKELLSVREPFASDEAIQARL